MSYRDYDAESFFARAAKDSPGQAAARVQELPAIPPSLLRRDPDPPTPAYLQARAELGMSSHSGYLIAACPWCGAARFAQCVNQGTGMIRPLHDARAEAAGLPPADAELRAMATEQVAESRARRAV